MKSVIVNVFGSDYNVRADSDGEHVKRVAEIVDQKMKEIDGRFHQGSSTRTAVVPTAMTRRPSALASFTARAVASPNA